MPAEKNHWVQSIQFFGSLPYYQKMRWIAHLFKVKIKHKERRRSLALASLVQPGGTIFDVGAHLGYLSKEMATAHGGNINIIAFEPGEYCLSILKLVVGKRPNVQIIESGVGIDDGEAILKTPLKKQKLLGIGTSQVGGELDEKHQSRTIQLTRLDTFCQTHDGPTPDLIKVDVEGGEFNVLKGAVELIETVHPIWYLEIDTRHTTRFGYAPAELFEFLADHGYAAYLLDLDGSLKPVDGFQGSDDYVFKAAAAAVN